MARSPVTLAECLQAIEIGTQHYEQQLKTYRALKPLPSQKSASLHTALAELKFAEQYLSFLRTRETFLRGLHPYSIDELMLKIAYDNPDLCVKIAPIFAAWLV